MYLLANAKPSLLLLFYHVQRVIQIKKISVCYLRPLVKKTALTVTSNSSYGETLHSGRLQQTVNAILSLFRGSLSVRPGKQSERPLTGLRAPVWQWAGQRCLPELAPSTYSSSLSILKPQQEQHIFLCSFSGELFQVFNVWNTCSVCLHVTYLIKVKKGRDDLF